MGILALVQLFSGQLLIIHQLPDISYVRQNKGDAHSDIGHGSQGVFTARRIINGQAVLERGFGDNEVGIDAQAIRCEKSRHGATRREKSSKISTMVDLSRDIGNGEKCQGGNDE